jgi:hypothetical protein
LTKVDDDNIDGSGPTKITTCVLVKDQIDQSSQNDRQISALLQEKLMEFF